MAARDMFSTILEADVPDYDQLAFEIREEILAEAEGGEKFLEVFEEERTVHLECTSQNTQSCILQNALSIVDSLVKVEQDAPLAKIIKSSVRNLVNGVAKRIGELDPRFECKVHNKGSSFNNLKVGRPDEFDFMLELVNFVKIEDSDYHLVPHTKFVSDLQEAGLEEEEVVAASRMHRGVEGCYQVKISDHGAEVMEDAFVLKYEGLGNFIDTEAIRWKFREVVEAAFMEITQDPAEDAEEISYDPDGLTEGSGATAEHSEHGLRVYYREFMGTCFLARLPDVDFVINVDLSPCVQFTKEDKTSVYLLPTIKCLTWQVANHDPPEIASATVQAAVRGIKAVLDITHNNGPSVTSEVWGIGSMFFLFKKAEVPNQYMLLNEVSKLLTHYSFLQTDKPESSAVPSYAITGTVVKLFRQNPDTPLCALVVDALRSLEFVDPEKHPLLMHMAAVGPAFKSCGECLSTIQALKAYDTAAAKRLVEDRIPQSYAVTYRSLASAVRQKAEPEETFVWLVDHEVVEDNSALTLDEDNDIDEAQALMALENIEMESLEVAGKGGACSGGSADDCPDESEALKDLEAAEMDWEGEAIKSAGITQKDDIEFKDREDPPSDPGAGCSDAPPGLKEIPVAVYKLRTEEFLSIVGENPSMRNDDNIRSHLLQDSVGDGVLYVAILPESTQGIRQVNWSVFSQVQDSSIAAAMNKLLIGSAAGVWASVGTRSENDRCIILEHQFRPVKPR